MGNLAPRSVFTNSEAGTGQNPNTGPGLSTLQLNQGAIRELPGALPPQDVIIHDGAISGFESAALIVDTEGEAAADELNVINIVLSANENLHPGMIITLRAKDQARTVTVKNSAAANGINTAGGHDVVLSTEWDLVLRLVAGRWYEIQTRGDVWASTALARTAPATTTSRGIGRVATEDEMRSNAPPENGPACLAAGTFQFTPTPTAHAVPQADADGTLNNWSGARFATCATASATSAKVATLDNFELKNGSRVFVTFLSANTVAGALTLNVNGTGVKSVYDESGAAVSASNPAYFPAGCKIEFVYDGTNWIFINRVVKRYYSSTMKARMYADGYKHQGGTLSVASNRTVTISFPFAFLDTTYTAQRNVGIQSTAAANAQESCCFDLTTTTMQTQVNTDHTYARWAACGY